MSRFCLLDRDHFALHDCFLWRPVSDTKITLEFSRDYPRATDARDEDDVDKESAIEEVSIAYIVAMALYAVTVGVAQQDLDFTDVASDRMRV